MLEINFDGACGPVNPGGTASYGFVIKWNGKAIKEEGKIIGSGSEMTNNLAEYAGLLEALKFISELEIGEEKVVIRGDSVLVCNIIGKKWGLKGKKKSVWAPHKKFPHLRAMVDQIMPILQKINDYEIEWVPREMNQEADILSKKPLVDAGIIDACDNQRQSNNFPIIKKKTPKIQPTGERRP